MKIYWSNYSQTFNPFHFLNDSIASNELIETFRDIIGKYELNENSPSVELIVKMAKAFEVPVDYLIGEGKHATYNNNTIKRIEEIEVLDGITKAVLVNLIDTYIRDAKARKAYAQWLPPTMWINFFLLLIRCVYY